MSLSFALFAILLFSIHVSVEARKMKIAAGFVIFRKVLNDKLAHDIEYLLLQTSYGEHHWSPPKGHMDQGETDEMQTAFRETNEETGLSELDLMIYRNTKRELNYLVNGKPKKVFYWLAELRKQAKSKAAVKLSREHQNYRWLGLEDACKHAEFEDMQNLLREYEKYIRENILSA